MVNSDSAIINPLVPQPGFARAWAHFYLVQLYGIGACKLNGACKPSGVYKPDDVYKPGGVYTPIGIGRSDYATGPALAGRWVVEKTCILARLSATHSLF